VIKSFLIEFISIIAFQNNIWFLPGSATHSWLFYLAKFWNISSAIPTNDSISSKSHREHRSWL